MQGRPRAEIVGDPFQSFKKIKVKQTHAANKRKDEDGQNDRRTLERFEFHRIGLNEKPQQLKAALVLLKNFSNKKSAEKLLNES
jgi:hypothetical protein